MSSSSFHLREDEVIKLVLEFLQNRRLHIAQLGVERETGVINSTLSDDLIFLRQLILDGQWDDVLDFIQPLTTFKEFDTKRFHFEVLKVKYTELLCIKGEASVRDNMDHAVNEVVQVLNDLEKYCASKDEYSSLCLLLTLPRLADHVMFKDWNPISARMTCFQTVLPLVAPFLPAEKSRAGDANVNSNPDTRSSSAAKDRLVQLVIKGILYESCVQYCHQRATSDSPVASVDVQFSRALDSTDFCDSDLSLLSWLQSIPMETFSCPFEQRTLNVEVERLEKPSLDAFWTEYMLVTPIKPKTFPHSAMSYTRPKAADIMSRSLNPHLEGLPLGVGGLVRATRKASLSGGDMSHSSYAGFHLTGKKTMDTSVDRLFDPQTDAAPVYAGTTAALKANLPPIQEKRDVSSTEAAAAVHSQLPMSASDGTNDSTLSSSNKPTNVTTVNVGSSESSSSMSSARQVPVNSAAGVVGGGGVSVSGKGAVKSSLFQEFQRSRGAPASQPVLGYETRRDQYTQGMVGGRPPVLPPSSAQQRVPPDVSRHPVAPFSPYQPYQGPSAVYHQQNVEPHAAPPPHAVATAQSVSGDKFYCPGQGPEDSGPDEESRFVAVSRLQDVQAVRCAEFHPDGTCYAIGSNSKTLRICSYPSVSELRKDHTTLQPNVLYKRAKQHKGSIYSLCWSPAGDLLATGSNDKTVKLMRFHADSCSLDETSECELTVHDGTVRDVCFIEDMSNRTSLLASGGAGDCNIWLTDCETATPFQSMTGHTGHVLSLYTWGGAVFVSGSQDRTVRFWDLRSRGCVNVVQAAGGGGSSSSSGGSARGSAVAAVVVDPSGRLLVSGHEDASCWLYDVRGGRHIQRLHCHSADVRSVRFSPSAFYLLTAGYDGRLVLSDMQGDLTAPLQSVCVARHADKAITGRWHPHEFSFVSTSADKTCTLWALPPL